MHFADSSQQPCHALAASRPRHSPARCASRPAAGWRGTGVNSAPDLRCTCHCRRHGYRPLHQRIRLRLLERTERNWRLCKWRLPCLLSLPRAPSQHCRIHAPRTTYHFRRRSWTGAPSLHPLQSPGPSLDTRLRSTARPPTSVPLFLEIRLCGCTACIAITKICRWEPGRRACALVIARGSACWRGKTRSPLAPALDESTYPPQI